MKIFLFILVSFLSMPVIAGGDKNRTANPIISDGDCFYDAPSGIDPDKCEEVAASPSGQIVYFCAFDAVVTCPEDADNQGRN